MYNWKNINVSNSRQIKLKLTNTENGFHEIRKAQGDDETQKKGWTKYNKTEWMGGGERAKQ